VDDAAAVNGRSPADFIYIFHVRHNEICRRPPDITSTVTFNRIAI